MVTGIRQSLQSATEAKRESVAFGDSIYAQDIGKLPATNLAETLNRIPGVKLNRDINGEGVQISVRGLGPSFSKVLLLEPYYSTNFDLGGEFYTGGLGYIGVALFRKDVDGFTANSQTQVPFLSLGIPYSDLTQTQQNSMASRGGPNATVTLNKPVNLNKLTLEGAEVTWVQPLDFVTEGLGFSANGTRIKQSASGNLVATASRRTATTCRRSMRTTACRSA